MRAAYLFDLDGTLVNTEALVQARNNRDWNSAIRRIGETALYPGVEGMLAAIRGQGAKIAIVTTSISNYANPILRHHQISFDTLVAFHDARPTKPNPACFLKAMERLGVSPIQVVGIGDDEKDAIALRDAGVKAIGAAWNPLYHAHANWDALAQQPGDVLALAAD